MGFRSAGAKSNGELRSEGDCTEFFVDRVGMDRDLAATMCRLVAHKNVPKDTLLVRMGDPIRGIYFLERGSIRTYVLDKQGNETTDCLQVVPGSIVVPGAIFDEPSPANVIALVDSSVYVLDTFVAQRLMQSDPRAEHFYKLMLQKAWKERREANHAMINVSAAKRYEWFCQTYPELEERVPGVYIASFLRMDPGTLSRVRSNRKRTQ